MPRLLPFAISVCPLYLHTTSILLGSLCGAHDDPRHLRMPAESGCRHACWSSDGKWLFVNNELDCSLTAASFDFSSGALEEVVTVPTLPKGIAGLRAHHRGNSDIHIFKDKFIYVGCRSSSPGVIAFLQLTGLIRNHSSCSTNLPTVSCPVISSSSTLIVAIRCFWCWGTRRPAM